MLKHYIKRAAFDAVGGVFVVVGVAGLALPVLPGVVFLFLGLYMFSIHSVWLRKQIDTWCATRPKAKHFFDQAEKRTKAIFRLD